MGNGTGGVSGWTVPRITARNSGDRTDMANPQNLRPPWPKGQSGNPAGHSRDRRELARIDVTASIPEFDRWFDLHMRTVRRSINRRLKALRENASS